MKSKIDGTTFGSVTINGRRFKYDVVIRLDGTIEKRKKKMSKKKFGTSHILSRKEAKFVYETGANLLIIGTGQFDSLRLSQQACKYFIKQGCSVKLATTPEAIHLWNAAEGKTIALLHVTC